MAIFMGSTKVAFDMGTSISTNIRNQSKTISPTHSAQTITPDPGYNGLSQVTVNAIPNSYIIPSGTYSITSNGLYSVSEYAEANINVQYNLESKTVTPSTYDQLIRADEGYISQEFNNYYKDNTLAATGLAFSSDISEECYNKAYIRLNGDITFERSSHGSITYNFDNAIFTFSDSSNVYSNNCYLILLYSPVSHSGVSYTINEGTIQSIDLKNVSIYKHNTGSGNNLRRYMLIDFSLDTMDETARLEIRANNLRIDYGDDINFPEPARGMSQVIINPIPSEYVIPSGNLSISSTGVYDVGSYETITVPDLGLSVDEIALRTLSGIASGNTSIIKEYAFAQCSDITAFSFPNCEIIKSGAFNNCYNISSIIDLPLCSVIEMDGFFYCSSIEGVNAPNLIDVQRSAFYGASKLSFINASKLESISYYGFQNCRMLKSIDFPSCNSIGYSAFQFCYNLSEVNLPMLSMIEPNTFASCSNLQSVNLPNIKKINHRGFYNCSKLSNINFPLCEQIGTSAFAGCGLVSLSLSLCSQLSSSAFRLCYSLISVDLPICSTIPSDCFVHCRTLTTVNLPEVRSINAYAFQGCSSLINISLPLCSTLYYAAFIGCDKLSSINLPLVTSIDASVFHGCSSLVTISLPKLSKIGAYAFSSCKNLMSIYLGSYIPTFSNTTYSSVFLNTPILDSTLTGTFGSIYVPSSRVSNFKSNASWSAISDRIVGI